MASAGGGGHFTLMQDAGTGGIYNWKIKYDTSNQYIVLAHFLYDYTESRYRAFIQSFDLDGNVNWIKELGDGNSSNAQLGGIDLDNSGNIYILGAGLLTYDSSWPGMIKLNSSGAVQWTKQFNNAPSLAGALTENAVLVDLDQNHVHFSYDWGYQGNAHYTLRTSNGTMPSSPYYTYMQHHGVSSGSDNYMEQCLSQNSTAIVSGGRFYDYSSSSSSRRHDFTLGAFNHNFEYQYGSSQTVRNQSYGPIIHDIVSVDSTNFVSVGLIQPEGTNPTYTELPTLLKSYVDTSDQWKHKYTAKKMFLTTLGSYYRAVSKQSNSSGDYVVVAYGNNKVHVNKFDASLNMGECGYFSGVGMSVIGGTDKDEVIIDDNDDMWCAFVTDTTPSTTGQYLILTKTPSDFSQVPSSISLPHASYSLSFGQFTSSQISGAVYQTSIPSFSGIYQSTQSMTSKGYTSISLTNQTLQQDTSPTLFDWDTSDL